MQNRHDNLPSAAAGLNVVMDVGCWMTAGVKFPKATKIRCLDV